MKKIIVVLLLVVVVILLAVFIPYIYIRHNIAQAFKIPTDAMAPAIIKGDRIIVDKAIYKKSEPQRGDILVFKYPEDPKRSFIKRLVGLPGEKIEIKDGRILINDAVLEAPDVFTKTYYFNRGEYGLIGQIIQIPEDSYYVLGDNSRSSKDSRYWGFVPKENIEGKASHIYYPADRSGEIK